MTTTSKPITKELIAQLKPGLCKEQFLWDSKESGFGVRAYHSKRTNKLHLTYVIQYREQHTRKTRRMKIGNCGRMTIAQARGKAKDALTSVDLGESPVDARRARSKASNMQELMDRYFNDYAIPIKRQSSVKTDLINWRRQILPHIKSSKKVADVTRQDVEKMKRGLQATPGAFNRARAVLSKAMELAEVWEYRPQNSNPCRHVPKFKAKDRERFLSTDELSRLGAALVEAEHTATENPFAIAAIRLLIFTGARRGEILNLRWEDVDLENGFINLAVSKTGKKTIFIPAPALQILSDLERKEGSPYVIPGKIIGAPLYDLKGPWRRIRKIAGLDGLRIHDLRHTFASVGAVGGVPLQIVGKLLGHASMDTTERYSHLAADPIKAAADAIANKIATAIDPAKKEAEVVAFKKKGA